MKKAPSSWTAIAGWKITYYEPTYGTRSFRVTTHAELAKDKAWLDAGGYGYSIIEIPKGS
jgi:hypothetical protein